MRLVKNPNTYSAIVLAIFIGFSIKPIYDACIEIHSIRKEDATAIVEPFEDDEDKDKFEIGELLPDEILLAQENLKSYNRPHTGFAFSGEAGHTPQITDPDFFL